METVVLTEGYYRWSEVVWNWPKRFNTYDRQAISSLLNHRLLCLPNHPLRERGKDGVELYIGTLLDGSKKLLFSLRQIEYLVEYIHQLRLNDPAWLEYLHQRNKSSSQSASGPAATTEGANSSSELSKSTLKPPPINPEIRRISLPERILPKDVFVSIESVMLTSTTPKTLDKNIRRENKEERKKKRSNSGSSVPSSLESDSHNSAPSSPESEFKVLQEDGSTVDWQQSVAQTIEDAQRGPEVPDPADYFDLAQQALFVASHGGTFNALNKKNAPGWNTTNLEQYLTPAVGRSLFLSLDMRARDDDPSLVIDVGYAALWYAPNAARANEYDVVQECGHWVAQEERKSSKTSPYMFGTSVEVPRSSLSSHINRKMLQLWLRAGKGPIYIIMHSSHSDYTKFGALGLPVGTWHQALDPVEWAHPGHATPEALGQRILLDTALLWAAVEVGQEGERIEGGVTTRRVKEILDLFNPGEFNKIDDKDNAGNKAMLTFILFDILLNQGSLRAHRNRAYFALMREVMAESIAATSTLGDAATATAAASADSDKGQATPDDASNHGDNHVAVPAPDDSDDDEEFAGVTAFYAGADGELVPIDMGPDDEE